MFKTSLGYYLLDVNTDAIIKISKQVYDYLKGDTKELSKENQKYLELLLVKGYCKGNFERITKHVATDYLEQYLDTRISSLVLQLTQNCNLRCEYCIYSGNYNNRKHSKKEMDFQLAKRGMDFLLEHSKDVETLYITFYGGEPLLKFDLIKQCVEYLVGQADGRKIHFNMTTNATLLTEEKMNFLAKHRFSVLISFDGPPEVHDKSRRFANSGKGSQKLVLSKIKTIKERYPEWFKSLQLNAVIDQNGDFKSVNEYFMSDAIFDEIDIVFSTITSNYSKERREVSEEFKINERYEYFKLLLMKIGWLKLDDVSPLFKREQLMVGYTRWGKNRLSRTQLPYCGHRGGPCVPGIRSLFLSADGKFYPCEKVSELSKVTQIGDIENGIDVENIKNILNLEYYTEKQCKKCWAYDYCKICIAQVDSLEDIKSDTILEKCGGVRKAVEEELKDYCVLRELGYDFETNGLIKIL